MKTAAKVLSVAAAAVILALIMTIITGCGDSSSNSGIPTISQAAAAIGATGVHDTRPGLYGATMYGDATLRGKPVFIATFASRDLENTWLSLAGIARPVIWQGDRFAVLALTPSETGCKHAMESAPASAMAAGQSATPAGKPPACNGLPDATIIRLAGEVIASALAPTPSP